MSEIGNNLKRARYIKNMSLRDVGYSLNISAMTVSKYEKGIIIPDSKRLIEFAKLYQVKVRDLLQSKELPKMSFNSFRKKKRLTGKRLDVLKNMILNKVRDYLEVLNLNQYNPKKLIKFKCNNLEDAEEIARKYREIINISVIQPISDLISILENLGIMIIQIKDVNNYIKDFDGFSEVVNNIPFIVLLDNIKDGARQRFTIAHELGHLVMDIADGLDAEKMCHRFASAFLMPRESVINEFGSFRKGITLFELKAFKEEYKVSYTAIIYRLKDLNVISEYLYKMLSIEINTVITKNDPEPIKPEYSNQFKKLVYQLDSKNIISLNKACELLGVSAYEYNSENYNY